MLQNNRTAVSGAGWRQRCALIDLGCLKLCKIHAPHPPPPAPCQRLQGPMMEWTTKLVITWTSHTMTSALAKNEFSNLRLQKLSYPLNCLMFSISKDDSWVEKIKRLHLKIKRHFGKQQVKSTFKKGHVIKSHLLCPCSPGQPPQQLFCQGRRNMLPGQVWWTLASRLLCRVV